MLTAAENDRITKVEGDAPMGQLIREHSWIPACLSAVVTADGAPQRVRLLGTDYVAFRDSNGVIGFLDEAVAAKTRARSCPVVDAGGLIWVWLGSNDAPPFPHLPFTTLPEHQVWITATPSACNWFQGVEATLDTAHVGTLHSSYIAAQAKRSGAKTIGQTLNLLAPRYEVERAPHGMDAIALRPMPDGSTYVRNTRWVAPMVSLVPGNKGTTVDGTIFIVSPVDDHNHVLFFGIWCDTEPITDGLHRVVPRDQQALTGDRPYDHRNFGGFTGDRDSNWGQDRAAMKDGHFSGFTGNLLQEDIVTQVSMGRIVDRTKEHLSSSDVAIIHARRLLLSALDNVAAGKLPFGSDRLDDLRHLEPIDRIDPPTPVDVPVPIA